MNVLDVQSTTTQRLFFDYHRSVDSFTWFYPVSLFSPVSQVDDYEQHFFVMVVG